MFYLFLVEFTVKDFSLWAFPKDLPNPNELPTCISFKMLDSIDLDFCGEDLDNDGCQKIVKNAVFNLTKEQMNRDLCATLEVSKIKPDCEERAIVGCFKFNKLECCFKQIAEEYEYLVNCTDEKLKVTSKVFNELLPLTNQCNESSGCVYYTMKISCFGPAIVQNFKIHDECFTSSLQNNSKYGLECKPFVIEKKDSMESVNDCFQPVSKVPNPTPSASCTRTGDNRIDKATLYDEYTAQVNGNSLTVRVSKSSHFVTRVFDTDMDCKKKISKNNAGKSQQMDNCANNKQHDCHGAHLTDHQKKTSCVGNTFKNSKDIPIVRGNIKYPGQVEDLKENTECYRSRPLTKRSICQQIEEDQLDCEGDCRLPKGIEVCKKGCTDSNVDVFVLKIGQKRRADNPNGTIELEMKTPKGPDMEIKRKETREVQVIEAEFSGCSGKGGKGGKAKKGGKKGKKAKK